MLGDDDLGVIRRESLEAGDDVARAGRVALVGEERGDRLGVGSLGWAEMDRGLVGHGAMVPGGETDQEPVWPGQGVVPDDPLPAERSRQTGAGGNGLDGGRVPGCDAAPRPTARGPRRGDPQSPAR